MDIEKLTRFDPDKIPRLLTMYPQWIAWKPKPKTNGKVDKIPVNARTLKPAKTNDPQTWTNFKTAVQSAKANGLGLGFVFSEVDKFVGIDLDDCFENGKPKAWAQEVVDGLDSYAEITPSGKGLHIITKAVLKGSRRKKGDVEIYESGRYFTVTGDRLNNNHVKDAQAGVDKFYKQYFDEENTDTIMVTDRKTPKPVRVQNERAILDGLRTHTKFQQLWQGDISGYPSHSEADLALCSILARRTRDPVVINSIFKQSALMRDKWDKVHHGDGRTYGEGTIYEALRPGTSTDAEVQREPITIKTIAQLMTTKFPPVIDVISGGILPEAGGLILAGESEAGKSMLSMEISLHLAMGLQLFGGTLLVPKKRRVLVLQCENPEPQLQQRLKRMITGLDIVVDDLGDSIAFADPKTVYDLLDAGCVQNIMEIVREYRADVVVIDPLSSFHYLEENDNSRMRSALDNITHISRETGCAAIVVHHYGKPVKERDDAYRLRGASSIKDWADTVISMTRKKHEEKDLFLLRFDKVRHGIKPKPFLCERNDNFVSIKTEEDAMITPKEVQDILMGELGGEAETKVELVRALRQGFDCGESTARIAIDRAEEMELIAFRSGKGRSKKVVIFKGSR